MQDGGHVTDITSARCRSISCRQAYLLSTNEALLKTWMLIMRVADIRAFLSTWGSFSLILTWGSFPTFLSFPLFEIMSSWYSTPAVSAFRMDAWPQEPCHRDATFQSCRVHGRHSDAADWNELLVVLSSIALVFFGCDRLCACSALTAVVFSNGFLMVQTTMHNNDKVAYGVF